MKKIVSIMGILMLMLTACEKKSSEVSTEAQAMQVAAERDMPIMLFMTTRWCRSCKYYKDVVFKDEGVREAMGEFVLWHVDATDSESPTVAELSARYGVEAYPTFVFIDKGGKMRDKIEEDLEAPAFAARCREILSKM